MNHWRKISDPSKSQVLGPQVVDLTIDGTIPTYFNPGQQFSLTNANSFLRVSPSLVAAAKQLFPNVATFDTTVSEFDILFTNASPSLFNVARTPLESSVDVTGSNNVIIPIPRSGFLTVG